MKKKTSLKITRPKMRYVYYRQRVFSQLTQLLDYSLVWIAGSPGCGKTTLINSYLEFYKCRYLWFRMSGSDNNLVEFLYHFSSALKEYLPKTSRSLKMLSLPFNIEPNFLFSAIFSELQQNISSPFYLVFDDLHLISNDEFHKLLVESIVSLNNKFIITIVVSRYNPPQVYSRLRARQQFSQLNKQYLDWNEDEVTGLTGSLSDNNDTTNIGETCFQITQGWVSGVILLIEMFKENPGLKLDSTSFDREYLFAYLASEIFENMDKATQILLLKASFLPEVDVDRDKRVLSGGNPKSIFENLCNRNYFTNSRVENKSIYSFHPLFKDFLQTKSHQVFGQEQIKTLKKTIADNLSNCSQYARAIELYLEINNWEMAAQIIVKNAETLFSLGKKQHILKWISQFTPEAYRKYIWLHYWEAVCYLAINPNKSYPLFLTTYNEFQKEEDLVGVYHAICGVIESIIFSFNYYNRLVPWIEIVTENYKIRNKPKGIELLARLSANMHTALLFCHPSHKDLGKWEKNVRYLMKGLRISLNNDHRVLVGVNLYYQYMWNGDKSKACKILTSTKIDNIKGNPISQGAWCVMAAINAWINGDANSAKLIVNKGMKIAKESGIYFWHNLLILQKVYACLVNVELDEAEEYLFLFTKQSNNDSQLLASMYHSASSQLDYLRQDLDSALENIELCMTNINKMNMPLALAGYRLDFAEILIARGSYEQAQSNLRTVRHSCNGMPSDLYRYRCMLLETHLALDTENYNLAKNHMQQAMQLGKEKGIDCHPWWNGKKMSLLYEFALMENIHTDFVIECIKNRNLIVNINLLEFDRWDWPVKIYTLGKFSIVMNQSTVALVGKSRRRPLALLQAILAMGIWRINQTQLAEKLWPDANGADALQALYTTVHRLRKLIGTKTILVKDGYIGLNKDIVWVDISLVHFYIDKMTEAIRTRNKPEDQFYRIENLFRIYKGKFLEHEQDEVWSYHYCNILHTKLIISLQQYANYLIDLQQVENALLILKRTVQLDILNEKLYIDLVSLLISVNRYPEAIKIYNECRSVFSNILGVMPSEALSFLVDKVVTGQNTLIIDEEIQ